MAELQHPNMLAALVGGQQAGMQMREAKQTQADNALLRGLAPQIVAGDPGAYAQAAAVNPEAAGKYQQAGDAQLKRLKGFVTFVDQARASGNMTAVNAALREGSPFIGRFIGKPGPTEWTPDMEPGWEALKAKIAMADQGGTQGRVQSTYIDGDGNRVAIMADGTTQVLGQNAPNTQIIDTGPGGGFFGVNKGNLQAAPVVIGGGSPQGASAPPAPATPPPREASGMPVVFDDPGVPPEVRAAIQSNPDSFGAAPDGATARIGAQPGAGTQGQQLTRAPTPPSVSDQLAIERYNSQQSRTLTPQEAEAAGFRPGTIVQEDGYGNRKVVQAPAQDRQSMSEAERKDILARRAKVPQLQNAIRGLDRIESALQSVSGGLVNTGPIDAKLQQFTPAGQELDAAVGGIQNSFLALTRVPGIGAQSDLEARIAALQYPSLDKAPEVNARTMQNLREFARDLAAAYQSAIQADAGRGQSSTQAAQPTAAAGSGDVDDLLGKYGVR